MHQKSTVRVIGYRTKQAMPELPDIVVYQEALAKRTVAQALKRVQILNAFVLRTAVPPLAMV